MQIQVKSQFYQTKYVCSHCIHLITLTRDRFSQLHSNPRESRTWLSIEKSGNSRVIKYVAKRTSLLLMLLYNEWVFWSKYKNWWQFPAFSVYIQTILFVCVRSYIAQRNQCVLPHNMKCYWQLSASIECWPWEYVISTSSSYESACPRVIGIEIASG